MKVNTKTFNKALISIMRDPNQVITLDANFLIPPDRSSICNISIKFDQFRNGWLEPIFQEFSGLVIHEAVYRELLISDIKNYVDALTNMYLPKIKILKESDLTLTEKALNQTLINKISPHTKYDPVINNREDRGEVRSLAYISVKGIIYFATSDNNVINLVNKIDKTKTYLDNVEIIEMYEVLYYLKSTDKYDNNKLKMLYKYQYYLTEYEKRINSEWGDFILKMDALYKNKEV